MSLTKEFVGLGVIKNEYDELLIVRRRRSEKLSDGSNLTWAFPGGKAEEEEPTFDAVVREVHEETGYHVELVDLIYDGLHAVNHDVHVEYWFCRPTAYDYTAEPDPAIAEIKWIKPQDLGDYFTSPVNDKVAEYLGLVATT